MIPTQPTAPWQMAMHAKAKVDGEDLLTPLVERAAQDIASIVAAP